MPFQLDTSIAYGNQRQQSRDSGDPLSMISNLQDLQANTQRLKANEMLLRERQNKFDDDKAVDEALRLNADPDGNPNVDKAIYHLQSQGRGSAAIGLQDKVFEWNKQRAETLKTGLANQMSRFELGSRIAQSIQDEAGFKRALPQLEKLIGKELASQFGTEYNPGMIKQIIDQGRSATDYMKSQKDQFDNAISVMTFTQNALKDERGWAEKQPQIVEKWTNVASGQLSLATNQEDWDLGMKMLGAAMQPLPEKTRNQIMGQFDTKFSPQAKEEARKLGMTQAQRSEEASRRANLAMEQTKRAEDKASDVKMTDEAIDMLAMAFAKGAPLPAFGFGSNASKDRIRVFDRAAEMFKNLPLAEMQAAYNANRASLTTMQRSKDQIEAYEKTAIANLNVFLQAANKVIDTGSPWINKPLRTLSERGLGSADQAAFDTARRVAVPEFARILTAGPQLGGVLSDAARAEVDEIMKGDATLAQLHKTAGILVQDAQNRKKSLDEQLAAIKRNLASPPELGTPAPRATTVPGGGATLNPGMAAPTPAAAAPGAALPPNFDGEVTQGGVKYRVKTDASGKVISANPVR